MNLTDKKYASFALVKEMMQTAEIVKNFDPDCSKQFVPSLKNAGKLFLTGEGSSRIFPAKRAISSGLKKGGLPGIYTEGSTQALGYDLSGFMVMGASNSGQTKEIIRLFNRLKQSEHKAFYGLTANRNTKLEELALDTFVLNCGKEDAVAATKSVIEQGLFYDSLLRQYSGREMTGMDKLADKINQALTLSVPPEIVEKLNRAGMIYFAGRNDGVAEELTLKTNEITRKKSDFLEGTYAAHGIEEVMNPDEVVIVVDPFESEEEKFQEVLVKGVGLTVVAISSRKTSFPTLVIPDDAEYREYIQMAAGWNILVETGISLGINLDKPTRARKVGNEYLSE